MDDPQEFEGREEILQPEHIICHEDKVLHNDKRAAPPIVPDFEDGNQHYTMIFDGVAPQQKAPAHEEFRKNSDNRRGKSTTRITANKPSYRRISKDTVQESSKQPDYESRKQNNNSHDILTKHHFDGDPKLTASPYNGRLGNRPAVKPSGDAPQPHGKYASTNNSPHPNHANPLEFKAWEMNPDVPITEVFDARVRNRGQPYHSPAQWQPSSAQEKRSKDSKSSLKWERMKNKVNLKKWLRSLFGSR
ncbi:hypothetical protein L7F22_028628 [Adiantum nelumboides]|nr:hypothetical protein [Adiantum nelumboides]